MKIGIVTSGLGIGGLARVVTLVGESVNSQENEILYFSIDNRDSYWTINDNSRIFTGDFSHNLLKNYMLKAEKAMEYVFKRGKIDINRYQRPLIEQLKNFVSENDIDILVLTSAHQISTIPILKSLCFNLKTISWIHESYEAIMADSKKFIKNFISGLESSDYVVCLTKSTTNYFLTFNRHTVEINNPVSIENSCKKSDLSSSNVSFVSRISFGKGEKGLDLLLDVAKKLPPDIHIMIAGSGEKKDELVFSRMIESQGLKDKITWHGSKRGNALVQHYLNSSLFISTSRSEGFSLVILEAMSLGLPILSTPTNGANELLQYGKYGEISEIGDPANFAKKIEKIIHNQKELRRLQSLSLLRAKDFDMKKIRGQWEKLIRSL